MQYKLLASLKDDMNQGWIWISHPSIANRSIVEVIVERKSIYCEALMIDHNYKEAYKSGWTYNLPSDSPIITINSWYRKKLGIEKTNTEYELKIKPANHFFGKFSACYQHPQIVVRVATWLGAISVLLGVVSVTIAICA